MSTLAAQDATMYWLSSRTRNDLFLLYCFDDSGRPSVELREFVARRSARIADLRVRLHELPRDLDYPSWVRCDFRAEQFVEHFLPEANWPGVCTAVGKLLGTGVDAAVRPWRLHVFRGIDGAPRGGPGPAMVVVLQLSHALADGRRGTEIARALFAESDPVEPAAAARDSIAAALGVRGRRIGTAARELAPVSAIHVDSALALLRMPLRIARTAVLGYHAFLAQRELAELTTAGKIPEPGPGFAPSPVNRPGALHGNRPYDAHQVRMIICDAVRMRIPGHTVTVVALTAVSIALDRYLTARGEQVDRLGAQVPMALSGNRIAARNNYRSLGVELFIDEPEPLARADRIAAALADRRIRAHHPLLTAQDRVTAVTPAPLLRRDVDRYPIDTVPDSIAGHTVVSSVHRGPADLTFGGASVRFTGGFPAIGSVMHLTHGVHGLGDTVTVSVHANTAVLPDIDTYTDLLRAALNEVCVPR
ncbi:wax ester/triacylglycerol synthase domain-containing protein [Nocardia sp. CA-107356]|uniref:wax ester/triacylglycerol synthase domain-containing protein n=1 Tax=Nocardia sp. CA-107356 TaxID=3239972 RepID=UPI003D8E0094